MLIGKVSGTTKVIFDGRILFNEIKDANKMITSQEPKNSLDEKN